MQSLELAEAKVQSLESERLNWEFAAKQAKESAVAMVNHVREESEITHAKERQLLERTIDELRNKHIEIMKKAKAGGALFQTKLTNEANLPVLFS